MQNVTAWSVYDEKYDKFIFNHIENGHSTNKKPIPVFPSQSWWPSKQWQFEHGCLDENSVYHSI